VNVRLLEVLSPGDKMTLMLVVDQVIFGWVDVAPEAGDADTSAGGARLARSVVLIALWLGFGCANKTCEATAATAANPITIAIRLRTIPFILSA